MIGDMGKQQECLYSTFFLHVSGMSVHKYESIIIVLSLFCPPQACLPPNHLCHKSSRLTHSWSFGHLLAWLSVVVAICGYFNLYCFLTSCDSLLLPQLDSHFLWNWDRTELHICVIGELREHLY